MSIHQPEAIHHPDVAGSGAAATYRVGLTADGASPDGSTIFGDIGLERLTDRGIEWDVLPPLHHPIPPETLDGYDAVLSFAHLPFTGELVRQTPRLKHLARFGAGYDGIDIDALGRAGVVVTTTPLAVRRPVALSGMAFLLALSHRLIENHRATATGQWGSERGRRRGIGLAGRTVGVVGFGGVGSQFAELALGLGVRVIADNHHGGTDRATALGVELVDLQEIAIRSDFVVLTAALTDQSHHLIGEEFISKMKPSAYLINIARGGLVDQRALYEALSHDRIAGAGLDVFEPEPPAPDDPLLRLDNVVLSPHALCWTEDFTRDVSASVIESILDASQGRVPDAALNSEILPTSWRGAHLAH